jgi:hypothetical protein
VAHVRVQGLGTGDAQDERAQQQESHAGALHGEAQRMVGTDCGQYFGMRHDVRDAQCGKHDEPHRADGPEEAADACGAVLLHVEQREDDDQRRRHHIGLHDR